MARLIDADELMWHKSSLVEPRDKTVSTGKSISDDEVYAYRLGWNDAIDAIMDCAPTADAVEVVRCKDCVYKPYVVDVFHASYGDIPRLESNGKCPCINADDYFYSHMPDDDWFCANGERREADAT